MAVVIRNQKRSTLLTMADVVEQQVLADAEKRAYIADLRIRRSLIAQGLIKVNKLS